MFSGDLEALKVRDPSLSPRGLLGLKEARGVPSNVERL